MLGDFCQRARFLCTVHTYLSRRPIAFRLGAKVSHIGCARKSRTTTRGNVSMASWLQTFSLSVA